MQLFCDLAAMAAVIISFFRDGDFEYCVGAKGLIFHYRCEMLLLRLILITEKVWHAT